MAPTGGLAGLEHTLSACCPRIYWCCRHISHRSPVCVRLNQIIDSHRLALANLYDFLMEPKLLPECFGCLFGVTGNGEIQMATGDRGAPELSIAPR